MNGAPTTWALVVGIDVYDSPDVPPLEGAVADALTAYRWLRRLGVPDGQILLHASPSPAIRAQLEAVRPGCRPARSPDIDDSIVRLEDVVGGTRLFVFLCGHGLFEPTSERLFLTQEFSQRRPANLGLKLYVPRLLEMPFERQFLFMDGCQNLPYSQSERQKIAAVMYGGRTGFTPRADNSLVLCYAASQNQLAREVGGRGLYSRQLFEGLDLERPWPDAVDLDFATGDRTVNLDKLVRDCLVDKVEREAQAQSPPLVQTPQIQVEGRWQSARAYPIVRLRAVPTAAVQVLIGPAEAVPDVQRVRIFVEEPPWDLRLPRLEGDRIPLPVVSRLPLGVQITARCNLRSGAPWELLPARYDFEVAKDQTLTFTLKPKAPPASPPRPPRRPRAGEEEPMEPRELRSDRGSEASTTIELRTVAPDGSTRHNEFSYEEVSRSLGIDLARGDEVVSGVRIHHHEHGPDFEVRPGALRQGYDMANRWAKAIQHLTPPEVGVTLGVRGAARPEAGPNLRIALPPSGARSLAGFVAGRPVVWVGLPGEEPDGPLWRPDPGPGQMSLVDLEQKPGLRFEPGPVRVRLDLPWGSWTSLVRVPEIGQAVVELPAAVGTPPLRVALYREAGRVETRVLGIAGVAPAARLRRGLGGETGPALQTVEPGSAAWALRPPRRAGGATRQDLAVIDLDGGRRALFPLLEKRVLALDLSGGGLRVEALSEVPSPAWDLLVAGGRLDALGADDVVNLTYDKWDDWLLGLAGAYAVYANPADHEPEYLKVVLRNLTRLAQTGESRGREVPDLDLLAVTLHSAGSKGLSQAAARRLVSWAERGSVPVLRWGVSLALQLLAHGGVDGPLVRWRDALAAIEPRLSPISVWTAWTEE
ncbi:MAG TPA: hypothetical protein VFE33_24965 [Thermoanaerobaculia bacterium]|nr:hypothetical protein [Thermoanaerobaculia bacterium]